MKKEIIKKIASEILKEAMPMMVLEPTRQQSKVILKSLRSHFGIEAVERPLWREYITYRKNSSNKFHYFVVFQVSEDQFVAANSFGRIGYTPRVVDLGNFTNKNKAIEVAKRKLNSKLAKGYEITQLY